MKKLNNKFLVFLGIVSLNTSFANILGDNPNWKQVTTLSSESEERENSKSVGMLIDPTYPEFGCSAFLISSNLVISANHCLKNAKSINALKVTFRFEDGVSSNEILESSIDCNEVIGRNEYFDYAILKCRGSPGEFYGTVELSRKSPVLKEDIYVIHQNCDFYTDFNCQRTKIISEGKISKRKIQKLTGIAADTLNKSSGSPVFSKDSHEVIALYNSATPSSNNWLSKRERGGSNHGIKMNLIVEHIEKTFPGVVFEKIIP